MYKEVPGHPLAKLLARLMTRFAATPSTVQRADPSTTTIWLVRVAEDLPQELREGIDPSRFAEQSETIDELMAKTASAIKAANASGSEFALYFSPNERVDRSADSLTRHLTCSLALPVMWLNISEHYLISGWQQHVHAKLERIIDDHPGQTIVLLTHAPIIQALSGDARPAKHGEARPVTFHHRPRVRA